MTEAKKKRTYSPNQQKWTNEYKKKAMKSCGVYLSRIYEQDLIDIWDSIPSKADWFKNCLREYGKKHQKQKKFKQQKTW